MGDNLDQSYFEQIVVLLVASLCSAIIFQRLKLPTIVSYIVVGAIIGPHLLGLIHDPQSFSLIAELGVVFLLFSLGLEFSLPKMLQLRFIVFGVGGFQVIACIGVFTAAVFIWGASVIQSFMIASALALSSTAIVTRELSTTKQLSNRHAHLSIGVLLFQDLIAVVFLILVPVLANNDTQKFAEELIHALIRGGLLFGLLMAVGKWVLPKVYHEVARSDSQEIFVLTTLVIALLAAWVTHSFHLSMALGGFITGMMLGEGPFKHQIDIDIRPFKDILLGLFFVTIGMNIDLGLIADYWLRLIVFTIALLIIKVIVVAAVIKIMGDQSHTALRTGLTLAQAGEFSLALLALASTYKILPSDQASFVILLTVFSMIVSPFLIRHSDWLGDLLLRGVKKEEDKDNQKVNMEIHDHVIIGGYGRVGKTIVELLEENDIPYIVIENNPQVVKQHFADGINIIYGDCADTSFLESCHMSQSKLVLLTFKTIDMAKSTVSHIRERGFNVPIIARCHEHSNLSELESLGADEVISDMLETSILISEKVLQLLKFSPNSVADQIDTLKIKLRA